MIYSIDITEDGSQNGDGVLRLYGASRMGLAKSIVVMSLVSRLIDTRVLLYRDHLSVLETVEKVVSKAWPTPSRDSSGAKQTPHKQWETSGKSSDVRAGAPKPYGKHWNEARLD